ncbi:hypothetical protein ACF073_23720 [Streptomyces sp. NPDC015171]|uniref:hypothetical protein n=1 Tax=Streptomyces sp. NPDC015171 TaxID=3364945 RepID=UPI0036FCAFF7
MFQENPIFSRLVAERGDVPAQVRGDAERIHHDLAQAMRWAPAPHMSTPRNLPALGAPPNTL